MEELRFPKFAYYLDESDPDVVILRRQEGSFVAAFSVRGGRRVSSKPLRRITGSLSGLLHARLARLHEVSGNCEFVNGKDTR